MKRLRHVFSVVADCHSPSGHDPTLWQRHFYEGLHSVVEWLVLSDKIDCGRARQILPSETASLETQRDRTSDPLAAVL